LPDVDPLLVEPDVQGTGIEPDESPHLDEWDPTLGDETPDMAWRHP
jgi:hypothetical protein